MEKKKLCRKILKIAIPVTLQSLVTVAVSMVDTLMLGSLGEVPLSASSLANQLFFVFTLMIFGTAGGSNVLIAQYWGKKDIGSIKKILAYTYRVVLLFTLLVTIAASIFPIQVMQIFTKDTAVIAQGTAYLRIVCISYLFYGIATVTGNVLRSAQIVTVSLLASLVSLMVNILLNWMFIFGNLGCPSMGIEGAALATTIARICECMIILVYLRFVDQKLHLRIHDLFHLDLRLRKVFFKTSVPVICNELLWSIGFSLLTVVIGHLGTAVVAAYSIYNVISQLSSVSTKGLSAAGAVVVGNTIGKKEYQELHSIIRMLNKISFAAGIVSFFFVILSRPLMPILYDLSDQGMDYLMQILLVGAFLDGIRPCAIVKMGGILRGGGDVRFVLVNDIIYIWILCLPLGYLAAFVFDFPVWLVFLILRFDDVIKLFTSTWRIRRWKWIKDVTSETNCF